MREIPHFLFSLLHLAVVTTAGGTKSKNLAQKFAILACGSYYGWLTTAGTREEKFLLKISNFGNSENAGFSRVFFFWFPSLLVIFTVIPRFFVLIGATCRQIG